MTPWRAMNQWVNDPVPFPGAAFVQWIERFYQQNLLARDELELGGRPVRLADVEAPVLAWPATGTTLCRPRWRGPSWTWSAARTASTPSCRPATSA